MSEELKQAEPKKMGWFRKYVLMQDLRETNEFMVNFFVILYMGVTLFGSFALVMTQFSDDYQLNLDELTAAKAQLHSYVYYDLFAGDFSYSYSCMVSKLLEYSSRAHLL